MHDLHHNPRQPRQRRVLGVGERRQRAADGRMMGQFDVAANQGVDRHVGAYPHEVDHVKAFEARQAP
jgi:hypothetical protein